MSTIKVNKIENTATADGGIAIDASGHVQVDGVQLPTTGALSNRNLVLNGSMIVAQRSTSETGVTDSGYKTVDRFQLSLATLGTYTVTQEADGPDGFSKSLKIDCTTADASPAADDAFLVYHKIEAQNLQHLNYGSSSAKPLTLTFYVKSNKTGNASFELQQRDNSDRQVTLQYSISSANTWEQKTLSIPADASGLINDDNGEGLRLGWWLNSGSNLTGGSHQTTWAAEVNADRNASNLGIGGSTSDYWQITGVQLEVGEKATPFEHRSYGDELQRCLRYYEQSNPTLSGSDGKQSFVASTGSDQMQGPTFKVTKRAAPTMAGHDGISEMDGSGSSLTIGSFQHIGVNGALRLTLGGSGRIDGQVYRYHWSADAEL